MRSHGLAATVAALLLAGAGCGGGHDDHRAPAPSVGVHVAPVVGGRHSLFRVSFVTHSRLGLVGGRQRHYVVAATGHPHAGCVIERSVTVGDTPAGRRVSVTLRAAGGGEGNRWCPGTFTGTLAQTEALACGAARDCSHAKTHTTRLATFHFRVLDPSAQIRVVVRRLQAAFNAGEAHAICFDIGPADKSRPPVSRPFELVFEPGGWRVRADGR